jgi:hypothetical protein
MADIEGFTRDQILAFSKRRQQIEAWRDANGIADTAAGNEVAALATRGPKRDNPVEALMPQWLERAAEVGITPETVSAVLDRTGEITVPDPRPLLDRLASPEGLTEQASTFGRADVIKAAAEALPGGGRRRDVEAVADMFLRRSDVVPILPFHPTADGIGDPSTDLHPADLEYAMEATNSTEPSPVMRRRDGQIFPGLAYERRYTTTELLTIEQRLINRAISGAEAGRWTAPKPVVEKALARSPMLTEGQRAMIRRFATSGSAIDVGVGAAGTGKTTVMSIIRELAAQSGTPVVGTALAARTAAGFEAATGIPSTTITRLLGETKATGGLSPGFVVVVDEAAMVGSRQLAQVSDLVEEASGKLILIGDHHQLAEIDAGGLFAALTARLPAVELTENVRQRHEWERTALSELRHGSVNRAVAMYQRRDRINIAAETDDAVNRAVENWYRDIQDIGDPSEVLLIGHRNTAVDQLNRRARTLIDEAGLLNGPTLDVNDRMFQAGDRVMCLKNRTRVGVLNGDLATITSIDTERRAVTLRLDRTDQPVTVPQWYLDDGHLDWGYAVTGHKAQGATARRSHTVAGDGVDREWVYVAMSRGRESNTIYLTDPQLGNDECEHLTHQHPERIAALIAGLARTATEPAALDTGRGPKILTDEQLEQRFADVEAELAESDAGGLSPAADDVPKEPSNEYLDLEREIRDRHRDKLAALAYQPPEWITHNLGERPANHNRRAAWDAVVDRAIRYRTDLGIPDDALDLLGAQPPGSDINKRVAWIAARRAVQRDLQLLTTAQEHGRSAIGR